MRLLFSLAVVLVLTAGCAPQEAAYEVSEVVSIPEVQQPQPPPRDPIYEDLLGTGLNLWPGDYLPIGMGANRLTGKLMPIEHVSRRPVAIVINNLRQALPQSGISQADILYEVLAEGGITRLIGIFLDFDATRIGPVRSARTYFIDFARNHDAIFVHHGASPAAYNTLRQNSVHRLDGMFDTIPFWRDQERMRRGLYEHSSYTSYEGIWQGAMAQNIDSHRGITLAGFGMYPMGGPFAFFPERESPIGAEPALEMEIRFSHSYVSRFSFDEESGLYMMSAAQGAVMDEYNEQQLGFANVIVQMANISFVPNDPEGRRNVTTTGTGTGYLFTNGSVSPIIWNRASANEPTTWLSGATGHTLDINKGRTYIAVHNVAPIILGPAEEEDLDE